MNETDISAKADDEDTLTREHPISEFLKSQRGNFKGVSEEEFMARYEAHVAAGKFSEEKCSEKERPISAASCKDVDEKSTPLEHNSGGEISSASIGHLNAIVLKFTTLSEGNNESASFTITKLGAKIGRDSSNEVSVPSDLRLAPASHARIEYHSGNFYLLDGNYDFAASVSIGVGAGKKRLWYLDPESRFSVGNSIFKACGLTEDGNLSLQVLEGPLKGEHKIIDRTGATFGRSSENKIAIPDRELSRKHSRIEFEERTGRFHLTDVGSTNGTYIQLVGPYGGKYRLSINDHILVGRTGFSVNRYDYGISEEIGHRQTMEDACVIIQHLDLKRKGFDLPSLFPQSFFGVFDGHGGNQASLYLSERLHIHVAEGLLKKKAEIVELLSDPSFCPGGLPPPLPEVLRGPYHPPLSNSIPSPSATTILSASSTTSNLTTSLVTPNGSTTLCSFDRLICESLREDFLRTDESFLASSPSAQHGSTATTLLLLGNRLYCANVGDSRSMLCRDFKPVLLSLDHKPNREDECQRIRDAGGFVINGRVMGELAVSRAFGDVEFKRGIQSIIENERKEEREKAKANSNADEFEDDFRRESDLDPTEDSSKDPGNWDQPLITAEPEIQITSLSPQDQFLLLACDGLFDVFTPQEVVDFVTTQMSAHQDCQRCCQALTYEAIRKRNSRDNVSVILLILNKWY